MPDRMPDRMPEDMSDRMPEDMPDRMPEDLSDRMPEDRMPEDMLDRMPNRMSEDMSDRMPEDLPVRKCINVMVGITRSKVFFFWTFSSVLRIRENMANRDKQGHEPGIQKKKGYLIHQQPCTLTNALFSGHLNHSVDTVVVG